MTTRRPGKGDERARANPGTIAVQGPPYERVAVKAYELYLRRGQTEGHDLEDWLDAENQVRSEMRVEHKAAATAGPVSPAPPPLKVVGGRSSTRLR